MATILMESAKVIEACEKVIARIEAYRAKEDEETIKLAISMCKRFSFKRGFYTMNRQEAIDWINKQSCFGRWSFSIRGWGDLSEAKKLLKLARHGDPVTLNENDIEVLF